MHVCRYKNADHLCFFQGEQQKGYCRGHGIILDDQYRIVRSMQSGGGMSSSDMHEFRLVDGGKSALMTVYQQRQFDMTPWNIKTGVGWIMESVFQEVDVETSRIIFEWRSLDHVDPSVSYTYPDHTDTSGNGLEPHSPWDYFHINSIDKNADGDYLVSSRHTSCIYKISGQNGTVLWRLHGANPSFHNINFSFSQQHDARWLSENSTHTLLSLYNNGYNGFNRTHEYSSGMVILIDHRDRTATQIKEFAPVNNDMISSSQGNLQILPNQNAFIGWGNNAYVSEHDTDGNILFWGYIAKDVVMNYRALKFEWTGNPTDQPALWTYSKTTESSSQTTFYVSWNGATRVARWKLFGAQNETGPYQLLAEVYKRGFETSYTQAGYYPWTYAEAISADGVTLERSVNMFTFVPSPELVGFCHDYACDNAPGYGFPGEDGAEPTIPQVGVNTVPWIDPNTTTGRLTLPAWSQGDWPGYLGSGFRNKQRNCMYLQAVLLIFPARVCAPLTTTYSPVRWTWAGLALSVCILIIGAFFCFRCYRSRQRSDKLKQHRSPDLDDADAVKPQVAPTSALRWWHWRRWAEGAGRGEPHHYFPLTERHPPESDGERLP